MSFSRIPQGRATRRVLATALLVPSALAPAALRAQQGATQQGASGAAPARRTFDLFAVVDNAATGVRAGTTFRLYVTNSGPMDLQAQQLVGTSPASATRGTITTQFPEITLFASAAPGDRVANLARVPTLANVLGSGAALSFNFHKDRPGVNHWYAADGALGFLHSGARTTTSGCTAHSPHLPLNVYLMPASDCP